MQVSRRTHPRHPRAATWWTLGFESFGALDVVVPGLRSVVEVLERRAPPPLSGGFAQGYPAWLHSIA